MFPTEARTSPWSFHGFPRVALSWMLLALSIAPFLYFSFLNLDPLHDGWFATPAAVLADGGVPYRDVVTSYGWFAPAFLALVAKLFGFELLFFRLIGFLLLVGICALFTFLLKKSIGLSRALVVVSVWLLIGLGQMTKDPLAFPAWGFWPNQLIVFSLLILIYFLLQTKDIGAGALTLIGFIAGFAPWVRAQGILILLSAILVFVIKIYQSKQANRRLLVFQLVSISFLSFLSPFIYLARTKALDEWYWQTIEMPRTGEWFGMPNPIDWLVQNFGLAFSLSLALLIVSITLRSLKISAMTMVFLLFPLLILVSIFPLAKSPIDDPLVFRKLHSFLYLYSNYNLYLLPILVLLCVILLLVVNILLKTSITRGRHLVDLRTQVVILTIPALTLIYYNFGHLWGISPLLVISILHYSNPSTRFLPALKSFRQTVVAYALIVSLIAIPQVYFNLAKPTFSYSAPGLAGMRGQDLSQVLEARAAITSIHQLPPRSQVFFLCEDAFFATKNGRYISDNIFYSSIMTRFEYRDLSLRSPALETEFVVYCPSGNTIPISELAGSWILSDYKGNDSDSSLQIYERR